MQKDRLKFDKEIYIYVLEDDKTIKNIVYAYF